MAQLLLMVIREHTIIDVHIHYKDYGNSYTYVLKKQSLLIEYLLANVLSTLKDWAIKCLHKTTALIYLIVNLSQTLYLIKYYCKHITLSIYLYVQAISATIFSRVRENSHGKLSATAAHSQVAAARERVEASENKNTKHELRKTTKRKQYVYDATATTRTTERRATRRRCVHLDVWTVTT